MSMQGNENLFFTCYLKVVLDDSISHYSQNIQTTEQYPNWDSINAFINDLRRSRFKIWQTLQKTISFLQLFRIASEYAL